MFKAPNIINALIRTWSSYRFSESCRLVRDSTKWLIRITLEHS